MELNTIKSKLRESVDYDIAIIYTTSAPPVRIARECKLIFTDDVITIPAGNIVKLDEETYGEVREVILDIADVTRIDLVKERHDIKVPKLPHPGKLNNSNGLLGI